jgi:hypothetical protein
LNTTDLLGKDTVKEYQRFGFTKGTDLYSVIMDYSVNMGAQSGMRLNIECGRVDKNYDQVYDSLNIVNKKDSDESEEDFQRNYMEIYPDKSVSFIYGDGNIEKLK